MKKTLLTVTVILSLVNTILSFGLESEEPKDYTVYESQNKYGTYAEKQRQIAIKQGLKPVVDTLQEHEKYGNDGGTVKKIINAAFDKTEKISASLGNTFESSSNTKNYALAGLTAKLNQIGGRLLGLE